MREPLYRGKQADNNEWICGGVVHQTDCYGMKVDRWYIIDGTETNDYDIGEPIRVIPETIGQYTGLTDKNGKQIFEGDIVLYNGEKHLVVFETRGGTGYFGIKIDHIETWNFCLSVPAKLMEVIGNIHDNPELVEGLL